VGDAECADAVALAEGDASLSADASRRHIREVIEERYTLPC
jgi:hypothetical protein